MTALKELQMEQKMAELETRVKELEEVVQAMGRLIVADQLTPQPAVNVPNVPNDITVRHRSDAIDYIKGLGYSMISTGLYINPNKTIRAEITLNDKFDYDVKFSRV